MDELEGKVAVITGAGSGIGAGVAQACADEGMVVVVVDVNSDRAAAVASQLTGRGVQSIAMPVDVTKPQEVDSLAEGVFSRFGGCHLLHNNAGLCPFGRSWDHTAAEWRQVLDVNLMGVVYAINAFVPRLLEQDEEAHIVNTVSAAALRYVPSESLYNTSKFALLGLTESLQPELARYGIGVSALLPGGVQTNIGESMRRTSGHIHSDDQLDALLAELRTVDTAHITTITSEEVGKLVLEGVRNNDLYIITHPGSEDAVRERHAAIEHAYQLQRARHPELP
jgi:NAD(P)-dependent dehydrogenase (short-subunit alcohol dehydrogenase family)